MAVGSVSHPPIGGAGREVVVFVPPDATPGISKVEAELDDGTRVLFQVPSSAIPGDELRFSQDEADGSWQCTVTRSPQGEVESENLPESDSDAGLLAVVVPDNVTPGKTQLNLGKRDGALLIVTVPGDAVPGDKLLMERMEAGTWQCRIAPRKAAQAADPHPVVQSHSPDRLVLEVPQFTEPGAMFLSVKHQGVQMRVKVPDSALPGDQLILEKGKDDKWEASLESQLRCSGSNENGRSGDSFRVDVCQVRVHVDVQKSFERLVAATRAAGGLVSPKLWRVTVQPSNMIGIIAKERIEAGEELARVPADLHLSAKTMSSDMSALFNSVAELQCLKPMFRRDAALVACITRLMAAAVRRASEGAVAKATGTAPSVWALYCDALLGENFDCHPYRRALDDSQWVTKWMAPSHEHELAKAMANEVVRTHHVITTSVPHDLLGPSFEAGYFLHTKLCILSRAFHSDGSSAMVPVIDFFNHDANPGVDWHFDQQSKAMVLTASRVHEPNEQLFISYGSRPNPLLFRTYGFTLPPQDEPCCCYVLQGKKPRHIYEKFLPSRCNQHNIHFDTYVIQDSLVEALNACSEHGSDPVEFLRTVCDHCLGELAIDPVLEQPLAALCRAREVDPASSAWWDHFSQSAVPGAEELSPMDALWSESCLRVKMSEYICLTAYREIVDFVHESLPDEKCLRCAAAVRPLFIDAFEQLRLHGYFKCQSVAEP